MMMRELIVANSLAPDDYYELASKAPPGLSDRKKKIPKKFTLYTAP
jgi:hypothetical protein